MAKVATALFAITRATAGRAARTTGRTFGAVPRLGLNAGRAALGIAKRIIPVVALVLLVNEVQAVNQIVRVSGYGFWDGQFRINGGTAVPFNGNASASTIQAFFDSYYGAGKVTVTKPVAHDFRVEFIGWPHTAVTYSYSHVSDPEEGGSSATLHQAAVAEEPPPEDPPPEEEDDRTEAELLQSIDAALMRVVEELETQQADVLEQSDKLLFLLEANAVGVCMIWGSYFWRMLILAKNQSRIF